MGGINMEKKKIKINGADMDLQLGRPAIVMVNGNIYKTSPVITYYVLGGKVYIETKNSIYMS